MEETWRLSKYNKYEVSNLGNIRSLKSKKNRAIYYDRNGYARICLMVGDKQKMVMIHKLVIEAFLPREYGSNYVNHKDGNKKNNNISNLEWCSLSENTRHMYKGGFGKTKIIYNDAQEIKRLYGIGGYTHKKLGEMFGVTRGNITGILNNRVWEY